MSCSCRKSIISSTTRAVLDLLRAAQHPVEQRRAARSGRMWMWRPSRMLSSTVMPLNSARFWNVRATPQPRDLVRLHAA